MRRFSSTALLLASACLILPSAHAGTVFSSGPYNGTNNDWIISGTEEVADNFMLGATTIVNGASFVVWANPGDVISTIDWAITSTAGGTAIANGTAALSQTLITTPNLYGYDIDNESFSIPNVTLSAGTYWLQLTNATSTATPVCSNVNQQNCFGWDENDNPNSIAGLSAWDNEVGILNSTNDPTDCPTTVCTETFTISGTPEPGTFPLFTSGLLGVGILIRRRLARIGK